MKANHGGASFDTPASRATQDERPEAGTGEPPSTGLRAGFDTSFDTGSALLRTTQDAETAGAQDGRAGASFDTLPTSATQDAAVVERALVELGIEWEDVMAFGVHSDRVVIIEGPVGYKRTWWLPGGEVGNGG
jgi:hypothetical protein